ncbi:hypothetical protein V0U79_12330 [Hyphobacterium sp. HN65]|uniref:Glycerophosphoryl diester phosphodiesterase membrane domain-containing protein n=1 Tax=Hyphobacterium lacteum TaxID=3116575 RepID=A0ABU7LTA9_9PROT|nr:hypothetical protein [Hyphobacterium sp. HN65]MEE2527156.1 hypothetical protein [Hyphobacterium sp. HN65]
MKPDFNAGRALSFAIEVFTARPADFILISVWTVLYGAAFSVIQVQSIGAEMLAVAGYSDLSGGDPAEMFGLLGNYLRALFPFIAAGMVLSVFFEAAWLRLFVRGQSLGVIPFRLGRDEFVYALSGVLVLLALLASVVVGFLGMFLLTLIFGLGGAGGMAIGTLLGTVFFGVAVGATATVTLPVLALGVLKGRVALQEGVRGARQIFWPLLGSALVAIVVAFIATAFYSALIAYLPFDQFGQGADGQPASWAALLGYYLIVQMISLVPAAILRGVASYAALRIDESTRPLSQTFE